MIYIAGPFFNEMELETVLKVENILKERGADFYSPRLHEDREHMPQTQEWSEATFKMDRDAIDRCDLILMVYHGNYSDSGTAWECGYAYAKGKPVIVLHTGDSSNLMVHESAAANITADDLDSFDFYNIKETKYSGKMF